MKTNLPASATLRFSDLIGNKRKITFNDWRLALHRADVVLYNERSFKAIDGLIQATQKTAKTICRFIS